jgi:bifunctional non-homologous end joining protein LigD
VAWVGLLSGSASIHKTIGRHRDTTSAAGFSSLDSYGESVLVLLAHGSVLMSEGGGSGSRDGVPLTHLDEPLFDGSEATKRDLIDYLDGVRELIIPELENRLLSVIRVHRGQEAFMQKNVPKYTPPWVRTVKVWAEASKRDVNYAVCNDRRTLLWFANQRAVEYHPSLVCVDRLDRITHLVLDLDPPDADSFSVAVRVAKLVRQALTEVGLKGAVKTSGAKGLHVFVPIVSDVQPGDAAAATRAIALRAAALDPGIATTAFMKEDRGGKVFVDATRTGGATVVAAFSPRVRPGVPVSFPVAWDQLDQISPGEFTIKTVPGLLDDVKPWAAQMPPPQSLDQDLIEGGHEIPVPRVQAMHEGRRRARRRQPEAGGADS